MRRDDFRHQRKAKARAILAARHERVEHLIGNFGGQARSIIDDFNMNGQRHIAPIRSAHAQRLFKETANADRAAIRLRLGRILQQVQEHLQQLVAIGPDRWARTGRNCPGSAYARQKPTSADRRAAFQNVVNVDRTAGGRALVAELLDLV